MSIYEYFLTEHGRLIIAGFLGSAVAVALDWTGIRPAIRRLLIGAIISAHTYELAVPLTKFFLSFFEAPKEPSIALSGFLMGLLGVVFAETLILAAKKIRKPYE